MPQNCAAYCRPKKFIDKLTASSPHDQLAVRFAGRLTGR